MMDLFSFLLFLHGEALERKQQKVRLFMNSVGISVFSQQL